MKKKLYLILLSSLLISSCGKTDTSNKESEDNKSIEEKSSSDIITSSDEKTNSETISSSVDEKAYYAAAASPFDIIKIYGVVGETFNLDEIDYSALDVDNLTFSCNNDGIEIKDNIMTFKKVGTYNVKTSADGQDEFTLLVNVADTDENRYNYPFEIDFSNYKIQNGVDDYIDASKNAVRITSPTNSSDGWTRITYNLNSRFNQNYKIECDATLINALDASRWFGVVFLDNETATNGYPYYQFDIRQGTTASNSVEITDVTGNNSFSYCYQGSWAAGGPRTITPGSVTHMELNIMGNEVDCSLTNGDYVTNFKTTIGINNGGNIGFQASGCTVKFENIKITMNKDDILSSSANIKNSRVNFIDDVTPGLKPYLIASGSGDDIICLHDNCQQYFVRYENGKVYDLSGNKLDDTLNSLIYYNLGYMVPNIQIEDEESLNKLISLCKSFALGDLAIFSTKPEILEKAHNDYPLARLGYIPTNPSFTTPDGTYEEVAAITHVGGMAYASMILMDSEIITKELNHKFQSLGYTLVANAHNGAKYEMIDGALDGCKLIVVEVTKDALKQANMIYDDTLFVTDEEPTNIINQTHSLMSFPVSTGHRGSGTNGSSNDPEANIIPENTIESFKWAYDHGADSIELDIHTTIDGHVVIIHDDSTGAYSNVSLKVGNSSLAQLQSIPLKLGSKAEYSDEYHIPTLQEFFEFFHDEKYKDKTVVIEIKDNVNTGIKALKMAKEMFDGYWYDRMTFISFNRNIVATLKDDDPSIAVGYLNTVYRQNNNQYWESFDNYYSKGIGLASQYATVNTEGLQEAISRGQIGWLWTFNPNDYQKFAKMVFDGNRAFTTNYINTFTDNKYKLETTVNNMNLVTKATTYKGDISIENNDNIEYIVLSDNATVDNGVVTRTGDGPIYLFAKEVVTWSLNNTSSYSTMFEIYSDVMVIE